MASTKTTAIAPPEKYRGFDPDRDERNSRGNLRTYRGKSTSEWTTIGGTWTVRKDSGDPSLPWALYRHRKDGKMTHQGSFRTSEDGLLHALHNQGKGDETLDFGKGQYELSTYRDSNGNEHSNS